MGAHRVQGLKGTGGMPYSTRFVVKVARVHFIRLASGLVHMKIDNVPLKQYTIDNRQYNPWTVLVYHIQLAKDTCSTGRLTLIICFSFTMQLRFEW